MKSLMLNNISDVYLKFYNNKRKFQLVQSKAIPKKLDCKKIMIWNCHAILT
jgi:hypothetical protein